MTTKTNNPTPFKGNWSEQKIKLMKKYPNLTEKDVYYVEGKEDEMIVRIQTKLGKTRDEVRKIIASL